MIKLRPGQPAPDVIVKHLDGRSVQLSSLWGNGRTALLIFLRHLAWLPCRDHVAQVVAHQEQFEAANVQIATVSFGTGYWSNVWLQETNSPFPFLVDQELASYRAYGLASSALRAWSPRNLLYYAKAKLQGRESLGNRGDTHQLGGDFVVGGNGRLLLAHPSSDPVDRPSIDQLLQIARAL